MVGDKLKILDSVLGSCYEAGSERLYVCPYCGGSRGGKRKMSINVEKGYYKCWHCERSGKELGRLVRRFGDEGSVREWDRVFGGIDISLFDEGIFVDDGDSLEGIRVDLELPLGFRSFLGDNLPMVSKIPYGYLASRGIGDDEIGRWRIGYCSDGEYGGRVVVPSVDGEGYLNYYVSRTYVGSWRKYKNPVVSKDVIFNELYLDKDRMVYLVEGVFDAIKMGSNSVPILGSSLGESTRLFRYLVRNDCRVCVVMDEDARLKQSKIMRSLLMYGIEVFRFDLDGYSDVGEMSVMEAQSRRGQVVSVVEEDLMIEEMEMI